MLSEFQKYKAKKVKRNGWQSPFHALQITTWVLFAFQQLYFSAYITFETELDKTMLGFIIVVHLLLSLAVVILCVKVVKTDASYMSFTDADRRHTEQQQEQ